MAPTAMKRKAVSKLGKDNIVEKPAEDVKVADVPMKSVKEIEKEAVACREKELKSMPVGELKQLVAAKGLSASNKADMTKAILKVEATERADAREREAQVRQMVLAKKEELESLSAGDLKELCTSAGVKSASKAERVEQVLAKWLQDDGVNKALAKKAQEAREAQLNVMEKPALLALCLKIGVDPFVKDVLVERITKRETDAGKFKKPSLVPLEVQQKSIEKEGKTDMVEALLAEKRAADEADAKKVKEAESVAAKIKELKSKSIDDLKKLLKKRNLEVTGKKEEMVEALCAAFAEDEAAAARKNDLKGMDKEDLTKVLKSRGLETSSSKDKMVAALLQYDAKIMEELKKYKGKVVEASKSKEESLAKKTGAQLKDLCAAKNVAVGGSNDDKIQRLLEVAQADGELDELIFKTTRDARIKELQETDKSDLVKLANNMGVDSLVKEVLVERILAREAEGVEPPAKKARK